MNFPTLRVPPAPIPSHKQVLLALLPDLCPAPPHGHPRSSLPISPCTAASSGPPCLRHTLTRPPARCSPGRPTAPLKTRLGSCPMPGGFTLYPEGQRTLCPQYQPMRDSALVPSHLPSFPPSLTRAPLHPSLQAFALAIPDTWRPSPQGCWGSFCFFFKDFKFCIGV